MLLIFFLPETSSTNILYRRTRRLRKITGNANLKCEPEIMAEQMTPRDVALMTLVRPLTLNFTEPMVFLLNLYIALVYGMLLSLIPHQNGVVLRHALERLALHLV